MQYLGHHIVLDFYDCNPTVLADCGAMRDIMREAAVRAECNVVGEYYHEFEPHGISGCTIISESHITLHAWPEYGYVAVDFFYCGDSVLSDLAVDYMSEMFQSKQFDRHELGRGAMNNSGVFGSVLIAGDDFDK
jgi:S-adenosylmethionine decarboxylase proenzyme